LDILVLYPATLEDSNSTYHCEASNPWGRVIGPTVILRLALLDEFYNAFYNESYNESSPSSSSALAGYVVEEGSDLMVRCIGAPLSVPRAVFGWIVFGGAFNVSNDENQITLISDNDGCWTTVELNDRIQIDDEGER